MLLESQVNSLLKTRCLFLSRLVGPCWTHPFAQACWQTTETVLLLLYSKVHPSKPILESTRPAFYILCVYININIHMYIYIPITYLIYSQTKTCIIKILKFKTWKVEVCSTFLLFFQDIVLLGAVSSACGKDSQWQRCLQLLRQTRLMRWAWGWGGGLKAKSAWYGLISVFFCYIFLYCFLWCLMMFVYSRLWFQPDWAWLVEVKAAFFVGLNRQSDCLLGRTANMGCSLCWGSWDVPRRFAGENVASKVVLMVTELLNGQRFRSRLSEVQQLPYFIFG